MEKIKCQFEAIVNKVSTLVDGSLRISFETREMPADDMAALFSLKKKEGWVLFAEHELTEDDLHSLPLNEAKKHTGQTFSQRNRFALYGLFKVLQERGLLDELSFENFYEVRMNEFYERIMREKFSHMKNNG